MNPDYRCEYSSMKTQLSQLSSTQVSSSSLYFTQRATRKFILRNAMSEDSKSKKELAPQACSTLNTNSLTNYCLSVRTISTLKHEHELPFSRAASESKRSPNLESWPLRAINNWRRAGKMILKALRDCDMPKFSSRFTRLHHYAVGMPERKLNGKTPSKLQ